MKKFLKFFLYLCLSLTIERMVNPDFAYAEKSKKIVKKKPPVNTKAKSTKAYVADPKKTSAEQTNSSTTSTTSTTVLRNDSSTKKEDKRSDSLKDVFSSSSETKSPLNIKSDTLDLNSKERLFVYKGNVELTRDDMKVTSKRLEGRYDSENRMETVLCIGDVVITKGPSIKATSNRALYKVASSIVELTEGPELYRDGNVLVADKVTIFLNEERSEAEGNVRVKVTKTNDQTLTQGQQ